MALAVDSIVAAFESAKPTSGADYDIVNSGGADLRGAHLAISRDGAASLLIPVPRASVDATRLTHGLALRGAAALEFARGAERWTGPAAVVECRDPLLMRTFAGMVAALVVRLDATTKPTWDSVASLFTEWERLLGRRQVLSGEGELGLWGELWCLARTSRPAELLDAWRGPEAERVDFLLGGFGFEVKAGRRPGVHMVSQKQVDEPLGDVRGMLVSMHVMPDPLRGRTLPELVRVVAPTMPDAATFEEKLASVGYSRDDDAAYKRRYALLESPRLYPVDKVPRVRLADSGVSNIRYQVELQAETALVGPELEAATLALGIAPSSYEYPCA